MKIWIVSREYAGIAEAGGVKNVTCSLAEELVRTGSSVTVFLPLYGCTDFSNIKDRKDYIVSNASFTVNGINETVSYSSASMMIDKDSGKEVHFVFVVSSLFTEKLGVYTYTRAEQEKDCTHVSGQGHEDAAYTDIVFQKAVALYGSLCPQELLPEIVHCQDAATALVPVFCAHSGSVFNHTRFIVTIHNAGAGYHHAFDSEDSAALFTGLDRNTLDEGMWSNRFEPFLIASKYAVMTTVSPRYAQELLDRTNAETDGLSSAFAERKIRIYGITNGIDFERYNPEHPEHSLLPAAYNPIRKDVTGKYACRRFFLEQYGRGGNDTIVDAAGERIARYGSIIPGSAADRSEPVYICYHGRLVRQKGISVLIEAADRVLADNYSVRVILIGQGEASLEVAATCLAAKYPGRCVYFCGYSRMLARLCVAVSDFMVLPSEFEPCGLEDFIAQIFGTIPVAHATGGLTKIIDGRTGFLYSPNTADTLARLLSALIKKKQTNTTAFANIASCASAYVKNEYSWNAVVKNGYMPLYRKVLRSVKNSY